MYTSQVPSDPFSRRFNSKITAYLYLTLNALYIYNIYIYYIYMYIYKSLVILLYPELVVLLP